MQLKQGDIYLDAAEEAAEWVLKQLASLAAWPSELLWPVARTRPAAKPTSKRSQALDRHLVGRRRLLCVFLKLTCSNRTSESAVHFSCVHSASAGLSISTSPRQLSVGAIPQLSELEVVDDSLYRCTATVCTALLWKTLG